MLKLKILFFLSVFLLSGCSVWPYKSDFDCKIPNGLRCKSLYEINRLADEGRFSCVDSEQLCYAKAK